MKRLLISVIFLLILILIGAQNLRLVESNHISDNSINCEINGNCLSELYLKGDTLNITIFINNHCTDLSGYRDTFSFWKDTLSLIFIYPSSFTKFIVVKNRNNVWDTTRFKVVNISNCVSGYDTQRFKYKLIGFINVPKVIQFNHETLTKCEMGRNNSPSNIYIHDRVELKTP